MKILILTGRFGMGHIKCADAIKEEILSNHKDVVVKTIDIMDFLYPSLSDYIYLLFSKVVSKHAEIYNKLSEIAEKTNSTPLKGIAVIKLIKLMKEYMPDLVICDIPIAIQYFSAYKYISLEDIPMYIYVTDVTLHHEWVSKEASLYFVGDSNTKSGLIKYGINKDIIHITGIPVSQELKFNEWAFKSNHVLVMGGGLGLIPGGNRTLETLNQINDLKVTLVCGKNVKLQHEASEKYKNINVIGYTDNIPSLMKDASVLITKPGGITTFEAIKSETPLYIIRPELDQELGNAKFIEDKKIGRVLYDIDMLEEDLVSFISNKKLLNDLRNNMKKITDSFENSDPVNYFRNN